MSKKETKATKVKEEVKEPTTIFIGKKTLMTYVMAALSQNGNNSDKIVIKARGRATSRAVDVSQVLKKFIAGATVGSVQIGTEEVGEEHTRVSSIAIEVVKS